MTGDTELAGDVVQETFARLLTTRPDNSKSLKPWLFTVATNLARGEGRKVLRRLRIMRSHSGRQPLGDPPLEPDALVLQREQRDQVRRALDAIPPRDREALLLREHGLTHREIAEAVGTTEKSVGTVIARALQKLEKELRLNDEQHD